MSPTFGILYCSYGIPEMVEMSLEPWLQAKDGGRIKIAAVSAMFREYAEMGQIDNDEQTEIKLNLALEAGDLDYLYVQNPTSECREKIYQTEAQVRDKGLQYLLRAGVDYVILADSDECFSLNEISGLLNYIQKDPLICWYRFYYKNLIFDNNTYVKGFCPPRVFRVNYNNTYRLNQFVYDNDVSYKGLITRDIINYQQLPSKTIPDTVLEPLHYTWNDYERSKSKIKYQEKRWNPPNGNGCSLRINEQEQKIEWNLDYFKRVGQSIPQTYKLECI